MDEMKTIEEIKKLIDSLNGNYVFAFENDDKFVKGIKGNVYDISILLSQIIYSMSNNDFEKSIELLKAILDLILLLDIDNMWYLLIFVIISLT